MSLNIALLRASFDQAKPIADKVADKFYEFLFQDYPSVKPLFANTKFESQKKSLINSLVFIVDNLENENKLVSYLKKMGARHVKYGTIEDHYPAVGGTLLKTFAFFFKEGWTNELNQAWTDAYNVIAQVMIEGANEVEVAPSLDQIKSKAQSIGERMLMEALEGQIDEQFLEAVRGKVRKILLDTLDEETEKLFKKAG